MILTASASGRKLTPWVIGNSRQPHSFPKDTSELFSLVKYRNNKKAWTTRKEFTENLHWMNNMATIRDEHWVLCMDNCPSHPQLNLPRLKQVFFPKGTTSRLQPLDQGIIKAMKDYYTNMMLSDINEKIKESATAQELAKKITAYDALVNIIGAWNCVSADTIKNCFRMYGCVPKAEDPDDEPLALFLQEDIPIDGFSEAERDDYYEELNQLESCYPSKAPSGADDHDSNKPTDAEDENDGDPVIPLPDMSDVLEQLRSIRRLLLSDYTCLEMADKLYKSISNMKLNRTLSNSKQSNITQFFQKSD